MIGVILLAAVSIAQSIMWELAVSGDTTSSILGLLISMIPMYIAGVLGNKWRVNSMLPRGYELEGEVAAESSEGALSEIIKPADKRKYITSPEESAQIHKKSNDEIAKFLLIPSIVLTILVVVMLNKYSMTSNTEVTTKPTVSKMKKLDLRLEDKKFEDINYAMGLGEKVYKKYCNDCHQENGKGIPPVFPAFSIANITSANVSTIFSIVKNGRDGTAMFAFKDLLNDEEMAAVITYLRNAWQPKTGDIVKPSMIASIDAGPKPDYETSKAQAEEVLKDVMFYPDSAKFRNWTPLFKTFYNYGPGSNPEDFGLCALT